MLRLRPRPRSCRGLIQARAPPTNVMNDDEVLTGKIALAHLKEYPDCYTRLEQLEKDAEEYWASKA